MGTVTVKYNFGPTLSKKNILSKVTEHCTVKAKFGKAIDRHRSFTIESGNSYPDKQFQ